MNTNQLIEVIENVRQSMAEAPEPIGDIWINQRTCDELKKCMGEIKGDWKYHNIDGHKICIDNEIPDFRFETTAGRNARRNKDRYYQQRFSYSGWGVGPLNTIDFVFINDVTP